MTGKHNVLTDRQTGIVISILFFEFLKFRHNEAHPVEADPPRCAFCVNKNIRTENYQPKKRLIRFSRLPAGLFQRFRRRLRGQFSSILHAKAEQ